ncbi:Agamous-like MADS-box protein AGL62 [Linum perenne]
MRQIEKDSDKMITFSKRRGGIYRKVNELVTLTDCDIGFLVFSPTGKAFSFGDPSFDYIANRFMGREQPEPPSIASNMEVPRQARNDQLVESYREILDVFDTEKRKEAILKGLFAGMPMNNWWDKSVDDVAPDEIQGFENAFLEMFNRVEQMKRDILMLSKNDNNNNDNNNVMNIDHAATGGSVYAPLGLQQQQVDMGQTNAVMSMGPTLLPSFPMVGPSEAAGSFPVVGPNGGDEAVDSSSKVGPNGGGNGSS